MRMSKRLAEHLQRFSHCEAGATAMEYGMIAAGIGAIIIVSLNTMGANIVNVFTGLSTGLAK